MKVSYNFTRKEEINSVSATPLQKAKEVVLTVKGAAITDRKGENGEEIEVGLLATTSGTYSTISATAIKGIDGIIKYMEEESLDTVDVTVHSQKSNAGREFITLELI